MVWNGSHRRTILGSAARTATLNSNPFQLGEHRGVRIRYDVTAITATPSLVFKIQQLDLAGAWVDVLASAAVATVSSGVLTAYPGLTAAANVTANAHLGQQYRVRVEHADADSATYSVTAEELF